MARDNVLIRVRNARIADEYARLLAKDVTVKAAGETVSIRLTYSQILKALEQVFCISVRTLEGIIAETKSHRVAKGAQQVSA